MTLTFFDFGEIMKPQTQFVIFGIPWDEFTTIEMPNSKIGPTSIREVSKNLAQTSELGKDISKLRVADIGDIEIIKNDLDGNLKRINEFIEEISNKNQNVIPIMMGGDHFCTLPMVKAIGTRVNKDERFGVLVFDAHLDFYQEWEKNKYSHATVSHRIYDLPFVNNRNFLIVGCRDIDNLELEIAQKEDIQYIPAYQLAEGGIDEDSNQITQFFSNNKIESLYISIDIDVFDSSNAPGTGYPIPGGFSYRELWQILRKLVTKFKILGFDVVEVAPNLDHNNITSNLAAKTIIELISFISNKL
ncbi:MAG: agmatinase [Promethearchaeia archaeon]